MKKRATDRERGWRREARRLAWAWLALLLLMLVSLGTAYLKLGAGNVVAGIAIAIVKAGIVVWWFMQLRRASAMTRMAAAAGLATLLLLLLLGFADDMTRDVAPATWQKPQQVEPVHSLSRLREREVRALGLVVCDRSPA
ncbi:MAG: cytochrome C oxidase subunit IV family protein [Rhizobacter sp.]